MPSPEDREVFPRGEVLAIPCAGNPAIGNNPGHMVNVLTQASDDGQWMTLVDATLRYPVLRMLQNGSSGSPDLCHDCSQQTGDQPGDGSSIYDDA